MFDWLTNPIDWINARLSDFLALPNRWDSIYERARSIFQAEAQLRMTRPLDQRYIQTQREKDSLVLMRDIDVMRSEHRAVLSRLKIENTSALSGAIVVAVIVVAAAAVVITILSLFRRTTAAEDAVEYLVASGAAPADILEAVKATTQEKAQGIDKVIGTIGNVITFGVLAVVLLTVLPMFGRGIR